MTDAEKILAFADRMIRRRSAIDANCVKLAEALKVAVKALKVHDQYWQCAAEFNGELAYCSEYADEANNATPEALAEIAKLIGDEK